MARLLPFYHGSGISGQWSLALELRKQIKLLLLPDLGMLFRRRNDRVRDALADYVIVFHGPGAPSAHD